MVYEFIIEQFLIKKNKRKSASKYVSIDVQMFTYT